MGALLQRVAAADHRFLWIEDTAYSAALFAGGRVPWLDTAAYVAWRRQSQALLKSDAIALPLGPMFAACIDADPTLRSAMQGNRRANFPLKTLLAATVQRGRVAELLAGLRTCFAQHPLAIVVPSPRAWLLDAYGLAFADAAPVVGEDEVDTATLHCADFLREFGGSDIDSVLLEESPSSEPADPDELEWYRSVLNVGAHYRWDMGWSTPGARYTGAVIAGIDYTVAPRPLGAACTGIALSNNDWAEASSEAPVADFRFLRVAPDAAPEVVLDGLRKLRSS